MDKLFLVGLLLTSFFYVATGQVLLTGQVRDELEPLIGTTVKFLQAGVVIRGVIADTEGNYRCQLEPGEYDVEFSYTGYKVERITKLAVLSGQVNILNAVLRYNYDYKNEGCYFGPPLINQAETSGGQSFTADQLRHMY